VTPTAGAKEGTSAAATERGCQWVFGGDRSCGGTKTTH
jgi:hypothetical protein